MTSSGVVPMTRNRAQAAVDYLLPFTEEFWSTSALEAEALELFDESFCLRISVFDLGHDDVFNQEAAAAEYVHQAQEVIFIQDV